ncbi:hypothetical protein QQ045_022923 [Rhodiola kirilowii]
MSVASALPKPLLLSFTFLVVLLASAGAHNIEPRTHIEIGSSRNLSTLMTQSEYSQEGPLNGAVDDPEEIAAMVQMSIKNSTERRNLGFFSYGTGNPIDDCWRCDRNWHQNRKRLADCGIGFRRNVIGGRDGRFYVVTDSRDDKPVTPRSGTLRHAVIQDEPLWIVFKQDMVITLKQELIMNSFKTIDGRGVNVHIAYGGCITIQFVTNVIIHALHIHDCKPTGNAMSFWMEDHG